MGKEQELLDKSETDKRYYEPLHMKTNDNPWVQFQAFIMYAKTSVHEHGKTGEFAQDIELYKNIIESEEKVYITRRK